jgi:hypothetical protein
MQKHRADDNAFLALVCVLNQCNAIVMQCVDHGFNANGKVCIL